jgi:tetratricopeptide (TPR) repeat protein
MNDDFNPERPPDPSGDTLARALRELVRNQSLSGDPPSPEEAAHLAGIAAASPGWQSSLAARLAATPHRSARAARLYLWTGAALAASLLLAVSLTAWWQRASSPERLLAEAYTQSRVFDLRIPGAAFADPTPQAHLRGNSSGRELSSLLDARARIERHLESSPQDPHWLELQARADLLEENFDPAIGILDRLLAAGPVTSGLLLDDASAYFLRGLATGSENDRSTALEYLRHADELAPGDPVVLFNEAIVLEDRGQLMNAVETWNRFVRFERDPRWLTEGRARREALEQKLRQLKTHQGRIDRRLATPPAMLSLAADSAALTALDEELSSSQLPRLLSAAFPMPVDRSRGSPCAPACLAARSLLRALAASLQHNHHDPWLTRLLSSDLSQPSAASSPLYLQAVQALAGSIDADSEGDYSRAARQSLQATRLFHSLANPAGEDRALVEQSYALLRSSNIPGCFRATHALLGRNPAFVWIQVHALTQNAVCDPSPGSASEDNPAFRRAIAQARDAGYTLLELRAWNLLGAVAVDSGDSEAAWRIYLPVIRRFYAGDYPAMRLYSSLSGLEEVEQGTPRVRQTLLLQREVVAVLELTGSRQLIPTERLNLVDAAIRAGSLAEAQQQMSQAQAELAAIGGGSSVQGFLAETETDLATLYLKRRDPVSAARLLDSALVHMAGEDNSYHRRDYAVARGQLDLAQGHPEAAEPLLHDAILGEEQLAGKPTAESTILAQQDHDLYAVLAAVWLAQGRPPGQILALWERYRLRILGNAPPPCPGKRLDCLQPALSAALAQLGASQVRGQIVLPDRLLRYRASAQGVAWTSSSIQKDDALAAAAPLELAVSSPDTPLDSVHQAARRAGDLLLGPLPPAAASPATALLLLEPDPVLGNLPWPSVETAAGPLGLHFNLEELPSLLLQSAQPPRASGKPLIVGASIASGQGQLLPEVLGEARAVARFDSAAPNLLLAAQATEPQVAARLASASAIHFAGHAIQQDGATRMLLAPAPPENPGAARPWLDSDLLRRHPPRAARLVVFSACATGKKEEGWNHGMSDIVATLASLGVPDVVATRWQIDSASALPMMDAFYAGLARGLTVPQALTAARLSLLGDPRYRHPYYWAAWYASGSGSASLGRIFHAGR